MIKLKCSSCGANMEVDPNNNDYAVCEYCGAKTKLSQDVNININVDDDIKKGIKTGGKVFAGISIASFVIFLVVFLVALIFIIFIGTKVFSGINDMHNNDSGIENNIDFERDEFNSYYEMNSSTNSLFFLEPMLNRVVTNNRKNKDHQIYVVYNDVNTNDPDKITDLIKNMEDIKYSVSLDYDSNGYVNKIIIK